jgi:holliday junction DNA helicase RuvB
VKLPVKKFCLIGATTKLNSLSAPLRDRFGNILKLDFYEAREISEILRKNASIMGVEL